MPPRRSRATIHDVARRAGVSPTTVSHTFSGNGVVADTTRERVRVAASALGYRPDVLASSLRNNRLGVLALVLRTFEHEDSDPSGIDYVLQFVGGAAFTAMQLRYGVMLVADPSTAGAPATALACDGFVVTEPIEDDPLVATLRGAGIPCVTVGRVPGVEGGETVEIHTEAITRLVLDRLRAGGARRIALIAGTTPNAWYVDTASSYTRWAKRHRHPVQISWQHEHWDEDGGSSAVDELFDGATPPDALYCMTGHHAAGALARLQQRGLEVPGDVQLLCGSDTAVIRTTEPSITAVDLQPEILAAHAVTRLVNLLDGADHAEPLDPAAGRIVERGSTR